MTDAIATDAGPYRHALRTELPQMPDRKRAKPLIYKEKAGCKVSKALKDIEDQDLTYPQMPENTGRPASVAITSLASSICRFIYQANFEPTMTAEPALEAK